MPEAGEASQADFGAARRVGITTPTLLGRAVVRGAPALVGKAMASLGLTPDPAINRAVSNQAMAMLRLGPDEWLAVSTQHAAADLDALLSRALGAEPASVVDVTQRQVAIVVLGPAAPDALATGIPLDLDPSAFPVGMATRTIFEKAEIVLWRTGADSFHIEVWRSFAPYVTALLEVAQAEIATGL